MLINYAVIFISLAYGATFRTDLIQNQDMRDKYLKAKGVKTVTEIERMQFDNINKEASTQNAPECANIPFPKSLLDRNVRQRLKRFAKQKEYLRKDGIEVVYDAQWD